MDESLDIINKNRMLIDNYYVDLRWQMNGLGSFENITNTQSIEVLISSLDEKVLPLQDKLPQESVIALSYNNEVSQTDAYKETLDEKEIRLRKILIKDISIPAPLKRKRAVVIEMNPRLIPKKKKRTESNDKLPQGQQASAGTPDHIIVF